MSGIYSCDLIVCLSLLPGRIDHDVIGDILLNNSLDDGNNELADMLSKPSEVQDMYRHIERNYPDWTDYVLYVLPNDEGLEWARQLVLDGQLNPTDYRSDEPTFDNLSKALEQIINAGWNRAISDSHTTRLGRNRSFVRTKAAEAIQNTSEILDTTAAGAMVDDSQDGSEDHTVSG